ncbi:MAG: type ISP restriction/modification enzyme [Pseudonocardiaceae bacterium]
MNREAFASEFDGDAIQYFYEPFLAEFDQELRRKLGVWYTPREIAEYQVARADYHLKQHLGISEGLAEPTVYILDPACGTGTYIAAILRHIYQINIENGESSTVAAERARTAATRRVLGFELLPAAFIICHLNITRLLQQLDGVPRGEERLRVYLTNALTGWDGNNPPSGETLFPELQEELRHAATVKHAEPVLVVIGNPPYEGYSTAETAEERRMLTPWIAPLWSEWGLRKHRLNDPYVRFWRLALERIVQFTGRGVVSFITNRKWLAGRSYPTMRENIVTSFQVIRVDDLHGAVDDATHPGDQSVFSTTIAAGIKRGTAIVTAVRTGASQGDQIADVRIYDYWGSATGKRAELAAGSWDSSRDYRYVSLSRETWWRLTPSVAGEEAPVDHYLPSYLSGVQPVRDDAVLAFDKQTLQTRMRDYFNPAISHAQIIARHPGFGVERARYNAKATRDRLLASSSYIAQRIVRVLYRPFDVRWLYWQPEGKLLNEARVELIPYWEDVPDQRCLVLPPGLRQSHVIMAGCCGDTPRVAFSRPGW